MRGGENIMSEKTPEQIGAKWRERAGAASGAYRDGVLAVRESPGVKAVAQEEKLVRNFTAAVKNGKWRKKLSKMSVTDWQTATAGKGADRFVTGVEAAEGKMTEFMRELIPHQKAIQSELASMPSLTQEQNIQRMVHNMKRMAQFQRKG